MIPEIFIDVDLYSEDDSFIGVCETLTPPKFMPKVHELLGSNMLWSARIKNYRFEEPEIEFEMLNKTPEFLRYVDVRPGETRLFTAKCATSDDNGTLHSWVHKYEVSFGGPDFGGFKPGDPSKTKAKGDIVYCEILRDGVQEFEVHRGPPAKLIVGGVDLLADLNAAMGRS